MTSVFPSTTAAWSRLPDRRLRDMQAVQDRPLVEEVTFGRVHVLAAKRVVLAQLARLEAHHPAARVGEREHEAPREVVASPHCHEPRGPQFVLREPALARLLGETAPRREAEPELLGDLLSQSAPREVLADICSAFTLPEQPLEEGRRLLQGAPVEPRSAGFRSASTFGDTSSYSAARESAPRATRSPPRSPSSRSRARTR